VPVAVVVGWRGARPGTGHDFELQTYGVSATVAARVVVHFDEHSDVGVGA
jgi:hypothetical protein